MATTLREGVDIVNESLRKLGYEYQIDTTSSTTMSDGLRAIGEYPPNQLNAIMEQMNLVLQYRNYGVMFDASKNKFRGFLVDLMENGFGIEDIFHELMDALPALWDDRTNTDDILTDLVSYDTAKIHRAFHIDSADGRFKVTVDTRNYKKVFTAYGVTRYIDTKLATMAWSAEKWLMDRVINLIIKMNTEGKIKYIQGADINSTEGVNATVETIKALIAGFQTPSNDFNYGVYDEESQSYRPVINMTNSENDIFIVTTPENFMRLKVQGYSNAFNLSQYELDGRIIFAPSGTDLGTAENGEKVLFYVFDRRAIVVGIKHWAGGSFVVPNAARINQWLLVEILEGFNTFFNAVAVTGEVLGSFFGGNGGAVNLIMWSGAADSPISYKVNDEAEYSQISVAFGGKPTLEPLYNVRSLKIMGIAEGYDVNVKINGANAFNILGGLPLEILFADDTNTVEVYYVARPING